MGLFRAPPWHQVRRFADSNPINCPLALKKRNEPSVVEFLQVALTRGSRQLCRRVKRLTGGIGQREPRRGERFSEVRELARTYTTVAINS
jgi:hypothetical protein